jgi:hypothetical protein
MISKTCLQRRIRFAWRGLALLALIGADLAFVSCAIGHYHAYVGSQRNWPTSPGSFADTVEGIPIFYNFPPRPYVVLGYLEAKTAPVRRHTRFSFAARRAKEIGADAIIALNKEGQNRELAETFGVQIDPDSSSGDFFGQAEAVLIRWVK